MQKEKNDIRDIYQAEDRDLEQDFNPQVSPEVVAGRNRDLRRNHLISFFFSVFAIVLSVALVAIIVLDFLGKLRPLRDSISTEPVGVSRKALPEGAFCIMNYPAEKTAPEPPSGVKPLAAKWVKNAAYEMVTGQQAMYLNQNEEALSRFKRTVELYPDLKGIYATIGMLYLLREDYSNALPCLEKSLLEKESFEVVNNLGKSYFETKQYDLAEKHLKRALELSPENPVCHKHLAFLYQEMKRENAAIFHFEKYLDMKPDDMATKQTYALYATKLGRWPLAETVLSELTNQVKDIAPLYFLLAQAQIQNGQPNKAIDALKQGSLLIDPQLAQTWLLRDEFNTVRNTADFKQLTDQLKRSAE